jgi:hypothetical protein
MPQNTDISLEYCNDLADKMGYYLIIKDEGYYLTKTGRPPMMFYSTLEKLAQFLKYRNGFTASCKALSGGKCRNFRDDRLEDNMNNPDSTSSVAVDGSPVMRILRE